MPDFIREIMYMAPDATQTEKILHWVRLGLIVSLNILSGIIFGVYVL